MQFKAIKGNYNFIQYIVTALLCAAFIITCIVVKPETTCLLPAEILILIGLLKQRLSRIEYRTGLAVKGTLDALILIYGSFSDQLAVVTIMSIFSIIHIITVRRRCMNTKIWLMYAIECELVGVLTLMGMIHMKTDTYAMFSQGVVIDILFVVVIVVDVLLHRIKKRKPSKFIASTFLTIVILTMTGSMLYLNISRERNYKNYIDILNEDEGECVIVSTVNNMAVTVSGGDICNDANIILGKNNSLSNQIFYFKKTSKGTYIFDINKTGFVLDVLYSGQENGTNVQLCETNNAEAQEWIVTQCEDGNYTLTSLCNNLNLDFDLGISADEINIMTYEKNGNMSQEFRIQPPIHDELILTYMQEVGGENVLMIYKSLIGSVAIMLLASLCVIAYKWKDNKY